MKRFSITIIIVLFALSSVPVALADSATILVNTASDVTNEEDGMCSLREAIMAANTNAPSGEVEGECASGTMDEDVIGFNLPTAPYKIQPTSALPVIERGAGAVTIDGASQPGYSGAPIVWLDGPLAGNTDYAIRSHADGITIRGLAITGWPNTGIVLMPAWYLSPETEWTIHSVIRSNYFGLNPDGVTVNANSTGIAIIGDYNIVGGATSTDRNVFVGGYAGIGLLNSNHTAIQGNFFGTTDGINTPGSLGDAINISYYDESRGPGDITIGGTIPDEGNIITHNETAVLLRQVSGVSMLGNSIYDNRITGIGLLNLSYTPAINDHLDADTNGYYGSNGMQNYPEITSIDKISATLEIGGELDSVPNSVFRLEFFTTPSCDKTGQGEGKHFIGTVPVTTDANGSASFNVSLGGSLTPGEYVTSTATDSAGNTSEFSWCEDGQPAPPQTFTVNTLSDLDDGNCNVTHCSLREAIYAVNRIHKNIDTIAFNLPGTKPYRISPDGTSWPIITGPVVIDGTSQPGYAGSPVVELNGAEMSDLEYGLMLLGGNSTVKGLALNRFWYTAIYLKSGGNNTIQGNIIGLGVAGTAYPIDMGPQQSTGIWMYQSNNNLIGGTLPSQRNVISGNSFDALYLEQSNNNTIQGNYIGTSLNGTTAVWAGSSDESINIDDSSGNLIGGSIPNARNIITNNIVIHNYTSSNNQIIGNYIGTDVTGTKALGKTLTGTPGWPGAVTIYAAGDGNRVGGTLPGEGNVISGNPGNGIDLSASGITVIQGNLIGVAVDGTHHLGNTHNGISIGEFTASSDPSAQIGSLIGGDSPEAANTIAYNDECGIRLFDPNHTGYSEQIEITGNHIYDNHDIAICLGDDGPTVNDPGDGDDGDNNLQNFPVVEEAVIESVPPGPTAAGNAPSPSGGQSRVSGSLNSLTSTLFRLEFFSASTCHASGYGQARSYLGYTTVMTNSSGNADYDFLSPVSITPGQFISGTATDPQGNTSELSRCVRVVTTIPSSSPPPALASPASGKALSISPAKLTWKSLKGVINYHVELAGDGAFTDKLIDDTLTTPYVKLTSPLGFGKYFWRVQATLPSGITTYSSTGTFYVTLLTSPKAGAPVYTTTPKFSWAKVKNAPGYHFQIFSSTDPACTGGPDFATNTTAPTYTLQVADALDWGNYYWRVSSDGGANYTPCWPFDVTNMVAPKNIATKVKSTPTFSWKKVTGVSSYILQVSPVSDFSSLTFPDINTGALKQVSPVALAPGTYFWHISIDGGVTWMPTWAFTVGP